ncbi:hypothetical protein OAL66_01795 [bacterium]|nr:hypothetical protein [bacterium]
MQRFGHRRDAPMAEYGQAPKIVKPETPSNPVVGKRGKPERLLLSVVGLIAFFVGALIVTGVFCDSKKGECSPDKRLEKSGISTLAYFAIQGVWAKSKEESV